MLIQPKTSNVTVGTQIVYVVGWFAPVVAIQFRSVGGFAASGFEGLPRMAIFIKGKKHGGGNSFRKHRSAHITLTFSCT